MANKGIICTKNNVEYITIRKAMIAGARTINELKEKANVCAECEGCKENLDYIVTTLCGCKNVPMKAVVDLVQSGVDSLDEIVEKTSAGTGEGCGKCKMLIENIIAKGY